METKQLILEQIVEMYQGSEIRVSFVMVIVSNESIAEMIYKERFLYCENIKYIKLKVDVK